MNTREELSFHEGRKEKGTDKTLSDAQGDDARKDPEICCRQNEYEAKRGQNGCIYRLIKQDSRW